MVIFRDILKIYTKLKKKKKIKIFPYKRLTLKNDHFEQPKRVILFFIITFLEKITNNLRTTLS